eukprot:TRINITY_DN423_c0_g1_i1.p1 TRINITY_DN423_c0_g1~~TRINITY_DN423_c0_g1_i1.p1  ORF type:complete len:752 (-),score=268.99 TRINITY_DN423_c0_g1_i1:137-2392(-)
MSLRFDNKVVVVTGAGRGLGKVYALDFAKRGAKVVVNDLGGSKAGDGQDSKAADSVVAEIQAAGGQAVPNYDSVSNGQNIIKTALDKWGRVDIVINNAGILRDVGFQKMTPADWDALYQVHLQGSFAVSHAAWQVMRQQKFGRIINVASAAGIYGNFGQAQYAAFKMALIGLSKTLALEGAKLNIHANTIAPLAASRLTESILPPDLLQALKPEYVSPLVLWLCHDSCKENGSVFEVGAGWVAKLRWERTQGAFFPADKPLSLEDVRDKWSQIVDFNQATYPTSTQDAFAPIMANLSGTPPSAAAPASPSASKPKPKKAKSEGSVDVSRALGHVFPALPFTYTERDVALYALGVGAAANPLDPQQLKFVYENDPHFQVLPTFGVVVPSAGLSQVMNTPGLSFNPMMLLHGEQYMELRRPLPPSGTLTSTAKIAHIYDKGKGALVVLHMTTVDEKQEEVLFNQYSLYIRGLGGFGGDKGPKQEANDPPMQPPHIVHREPTQDNQALLYRLSGDMNPLHADPSMAAMGGFHKPILHGLCTFGYASRAVLQHFCKNDATRFKSIKARFSSHVFPGETIITEMWQVAPTRILFRCKVAERGTYVLLGGVVELHPDPSAPAAPASPAAPAPAPASSSATAGSDAVFKQLQQQLAADPKRAAALVKKVNGIYQFVVKKSGGEGYWVVDLKNGQGSVQQGKSSQKPDCTLTIGEADLVEMLAGKLNPQTAFMKGKLKIGGNIGVATKFGEVLALKAKL